MSRLQTLPKSSSLASLAALCIVAASCGGAALEPADDATEAQQLELRGAGGGGGGGGSTAGSGGGGGSSQTALDAGVAASWSPALDARCSVQGGAALLSVSSSPVGVWGSLCRIWSRIRGTAPRGGVSSKCYVMLEMMSRDGKNFDFIPMEVLENAEKLCPVLEQMFDEIMKSGADAFKTVSKEVMCKRLWEGCFRLPSEGSKWCLAKYDILCEFPMK
jgi:hypothetical protein